MRRWTCWGILAVLLLGLAPSRAKAEENATTVLVYLCGSDLETEEESATDDLEEMILGMSDGGGVTLLVETGGADEWSMKGVSNLSNQRHLVTENGLITVEDDLGARSMGDPNTLSDFIAYGVAHYPAERYMLILWDHGGGPAEGVCADETRGGDMLTLTELSDALEDGLPEDESFDLIAMDACLMGSLECALAVAPYADVYLASEETVPGYGYAYDKWLPALIANPRMSAEDLAQVIVDSFIEQYEGVYRDSATLSAVDTSRLSGVAEALKELSNALDERIEAGQFANVSRARQSTRSFGEYLGDDASDLVDIRLLANAYAPLAPIEAAALTAAFEDCVLANGATRDMAEYAHGLSVYAPFSTSKYQQGMAEVYEMVDELSGYASFTENFTTLLHGGSYGFSESRPQNLFTSDDGGVSGLFASGNLWADASPSATEAPLGNLWGELAPHATESPLSGLWDGLASDGGHTLGNLWAGALQTGDAYYSAGETNGNLAGNLWAGLSDSSIDEAAGAYFSQSDTTLQSVYAMQLTREDLDNLAAARGTLVLEQDGEQIVLGSLGESVIDWSTGSIYSLFDGSWPCIDGQMVSLTATGGGRCLAPVAIGGLDMYLLLAEDGGQYEVLGATQGYDSETGLPIRGYMELSPGVVVTPTFASLDGEYVYYGHEIIVGEQGLEVSWEPVEGDYLYAFELTNVYGESSLTEYVELSF